MNDKQRIDWLQKQQGYALVSDDHSHWAVVIDGIQSIPDKFPDHIYSSFFIKKNDWHKTIRQAIDAAIKQDANG